MEHDPNELVVAVWAFSHLASDSLLDRVFTLDGVQSIGETKADLYKTIEQLDREREAMQHQGVEVNEQLGIPPDTDCQFIILLPARLRKSPPFRLRHTKQGGLAFLEHVERSIWKALFEKTLEPVPVVLLTNDDPQQNFVYVGWDVDLGALAIEVQQDDRRQTVRIDIKNPRR